ncbi:MAG: HEAT repeat domain-containing protein [Xanthomonadales bacterium]|nr:HEAT repeat domain-containing protein [Xanthomonadales bacterium]
MADHQNDNPLEFSDAEDRALWDELGQLPREAPPRTLRRDFYRRLRREEHRTGLSSLFAWLKPALPAVATLVIGLLVGLQWPRATGPSPDIESLQAQVQALSQTVALALLRDESASERLRGVTIASNLGEDDHMTSALLRTAERDPVASVRNAAIEALGPRLNEPEVATEIMRLLKETDSVLVQAALAELIMAWGDEEKLQRLVNAAEAGELLPEVTDFVMTRIRRNTA